MRRITTAALEAPAPTTLTEASAAVARIGALMTRIADTQARLNASVAEVRAAHEAEARPLREEIERLRRGVHAWAEAHRAELTQDGRTKTVRLPSGEVAWRQRPPSVRLSGMAGIIEAIRERGLHGFLRVKAEVNKEAMLAEPEVAVTLPGVSIGSAGEEFVIAPTGLALAEVVS